MLEIKVFCQGSLKEKYLKDACDEYIKRLSAYCRLDICETKSDSPDALRETVKQFKGYKLCLCIEGKQLSSEEFAEQIEKITNRGSSSIALIIGGSDGIAEDIKNMCDFRLSFSKMTFPHQLMRVILLEQVYRAFTILNNGKYHK